VPFASDINSGNTPPNYRQTFNWFSTASSIFPIMHVLHLLPSLSERVRPGWPVTWNLA